MAVNWRVQGNLKKITADIKKIIKGAVVYAVGDASHLSRKSDHNPFNWGYGVVVSAIDVMIRNGFTKADAVNLVKALKGRSDIQYIIYNRTIWSKSYGWKARKYTGSDPHTDHVHVSAAHTKAADRDTRGVIFRHPPTTPSPVKKPSAKPVSNPSKAPAFPGGPQSYYQEYVGNRNIPYRGGVMQAQTQLKKLGYKITADGFFGEQTTFNIKKFQKANNLKPDGLLGPATWAKLFAKTVSV